MVHLSVLSLSYGSELNYCKGKLGDLAVLDTVLTLLTAQLG